MKNLDPFKLKNNIEQDAYRDIESNKVGAAEIIVNQNGKRVYDGCFGYDNLNKKQLQKGKIFRLASMTKPITAAAVLLECERGNLDLMANISDYIDGFDNLDVCKVIDGKLVVTGKAKNQIKVINLLTHTSGIGSGDAGVIEDLMIRNNENITLKTATDFYSKQPLAFEPFTAQDYSATAAFDVAARIVEIVSGMPFDKYLKQNIFDKLGMVNTTFTPSKEQWKNIIWMHDRTDCGKSAIGKTTVDCVFERIPTTHFCGGAGLVSTAEEFSLFAEMLLRGGTSVNGERIITSDSVEKMQSPYVPEAIMPGRERWGLGVRVITKKENTALCCGTFGWSGAWGSHFFIDPTNKITAIYMKNSRFEGGAANRTAENFERDVMNALTL